MSRGLVPVTLGLTASSAIMIATHSRLQLDRGGDYAGTAFTAYFMRVHPLWAFAVAALLGLFGLI